MTYLFNNLYYYRFRNCAQIPSDCSLTKHPRDRAGSGRCERYCYEFGFGDIDDNPLGRHLRRAESASFSAGKRLAIMIRGRSREQANDECR